jgi:cytidylate kinase
MAVITLARQVGSGGQSIARLLGERLGMRVLGRRELRAEAAAQGMPLPRAFADFADEPALGVALPVGASPWYLSVGELEFDDALRGSFAALDQPASLLEEFAQERRAILLTVASLIFDIASRDDAIIVGAGAQYLLSGIPGVIRLKAIAPADVRRERLTATYDLSADDALAAIERADREQRDYNRAVFGADWDDPLHWDIVINTEVLDPAAVCDCVTALVVRDGSRLSIPPEHRAALSHAAMINRVLRLEAPPAVWLLAMPKADSVILQGDVLSAEHADEVLRLVQSTGGSVPVELAVTVAGRALAP